jgi:hypothetical protein
MAQLHGSCRTAARAAIPGNNKHASPKHASQPIFCTFRNIGPPFIFPLYGWSVAAAGMPVWRVPLSAFLT